MASVVRRIASRLRRGVSRRVGGALERVGLRGSRQEPPPSPPEPTIVVRPISSSEPPEKPAPEPPIEPVDDAAGPMLTFEQVQDLFEDMVRPALQSDGGDITLVRVEDNDVFVELVGACHSCPSAIITMQDGIERLLREEYPHFGRLVRVDEGF